jgi:hypothetical protein
VTADALALAELTYSVDASWLGATGTGVTNDHAALQAAIDLAGEHGYGVWLPKGGYRFDATLHMRQGVMLRGVWSDVDDVGSGSGAETTRLIWGGAQNGVMLYVHAETPGQVVTGAGIDGIVIDGYASPTAVAGTGVWFKGTQHAVVGRLRVRNIEVQGMLFDDEVIGTDGAISTSNEVRDYEFVHGFWNGERMVGAYAIGLLFNGSSDDPVYGGSTKNIVYRIRGTYYHGDLLRFRFADNNVVYFVHGIAINAGPAGTYPAGTGFALRFAAVTAATPHAAYGFPAGNRVFDINGSVLSQSHSHGNWIDRHSSEGGSITVEPNSHLIYTSFDYVTLAVHETHRYTMTDERDIGIGEVRAFGDAWPAEVAGWWAVVGLGETGSSRLSGRTRPYNWGSGTVTHLRVTFGMGTTNSAALVRFVVKAAAVKAQRADAALRGGPAPPVPTYQANVAQVVAVTDAATVVQYVDIPIHLAYPHGSDVLFQVERTPTDPSDTAQGVVNVYGLTLLYASTGPTVTATTPYSVNPPPYSPISTYSM